MKQFTSTDKHFERGTTLWNCNANVGKILEGCTKWLEMNHYIDYATRCKINNDCNTMRGFQLVWEHLESHMFEVNESNPIKTPQGNIFQIAAGVSKVAFCMSITKDEFTAKGKTTLQDNKRRTAKFVLKFNKRPIKAYALDTIDGEKKLLENEGAFHQQVISEKETYDKLSKFDDIEPHIIPVWRYYKRYNCVLEDYAEFVGSLHECCRRTNESYERMVRLFTKYGIGDLHGGNCGIYQGHVVAIDYGL